MSTQVNDEDLFDFDTEVRPMLEALCNKLLERARMETLEEEELRIVREQQREFEQVRNAELIEAQQLEACENRKQEEIQRRKLQQKASKELDLNTHKKLFARVFAKDYLKKLRPDTIETLVSQGVFREPGEKALLGHIVPWIYENTVDAFEDDNDMDALINELTQSALDQIANDHDDALKKERERRERKLLEEQRKAEELRIQQEKLRAEQEEQKRKEDLQKLHEDIDQQIVERGELHNEILSQPMTNIHGNFQLKPTVGVFGGLLGQLAISLTAAVKTLGNDNFIDEKTAYKFFVILVSDILKADNYDLFISSELEKIVIEKGGKLDELNFLDEETAEQFIEEFKAHTGGDELLNEFVKNFEKYGINNEIIKLIINSLMRIIFLKFTEKAMQGKQGNARRKLKLVTIPEGFKHDPNKPQAIVRIRIPLDRSEDEQPSNTEEANEEEDQEEVVEEKKEEEKKEVEVKVYPELEYEDRVLAISPATENLYIYVCHQAAARELRNQICEFIKDHFDEDFANVKLEDIQKKAEEIGVRAENDFMKMFSDLPIFDYEKN